MHNWKKHDENSKRCGYANILKFIILSFGEDQQHTHTYIEKKHKQTYKSTLIQNTHVDRKGK